MRNEILTMSDLNTERVGGLTPLFKDKISIMVCKALHDAIPEWDTIDYRQVMSRVCRQLLDRGCVGSYEKVVKDVNMAIKRYKNESMF